jgi:hypothetical protein
VVPHKQAAGVRDYARAWVRLEPVNGGFWKAPSGQIFINYCRSSGGRMESEPRFSSQKILISALLIGIVLIGLLVGLDQLTAKASGGVSEQSLLLTGIPSATCAMMPTEMTTATPTAMDTMMPTEMPTSTCMMPVGTPTEISTMMAP